MNKTDQEGKIFCWFIETEQEDNIFYLFIETEQKDYIFYWFTETDTAPDKARFLNQNIVDIYSSFSMKINVMVIIRGASPMRF